MEEQVIMAAILGVWQEATRQTDARLQSSLQGTVD